MRNHHRIKDIVCYVGTRKLVVLAGDMRNGEPHITGHAVILHPEGFKNGFVTHLDKASQSVEKALESLIPEFKNKEDVLLDLPVSVVLGNSKLKTYTYGSSQYYEGFRRIISPQDVGAVIEQTRSVANLPLSEHILQTLPVSFLVNDLEGVSNPLGLEAQRLGVCLKMFTMDRQEFRNIAKVFETAEIEVKDYFPKMLTASEAALTDEEKSQGVLLIDIAAEITALTAWRNEELVNTRILPLGGRYFSSQLANLWEIDLEDAEKVKEQYGSLEPQPAFKEELIPIVDRNGKKSRQISRKEFQNKYQELAKDWLQQILSAADEFTREEKIYHPRYVITGGGTQIDGFLEFIQGEFSKEARLGLTRRLEAPNELLVDPSLTAALGMYCWLGYTGTEKSRLLAPQNLLQRTFSFAKDWLSTYF